jgi:dihydroflavonol-4-reductase
VRILVTGASGFIGKHLIARLQHDGHAVTALVRPTSDVSALRAAGVHLASGDVTEPNTLAPALRHQEVVFHLAAVVGKTPGGWSNHLAVGVQGTANVIDAAVNAGVERLISLSSYAVYARHPDGVPLEETAPLNEDPESWNHYARQKVLSEQLVWKAASAGRIRATTFRPPTVIGPGDPGLVPLMQAVLSSPLGLLANDGGNRHPVVIVEDLAVALARAATTDTSIGKAYNVAGHDPITKEGLLQLFQHAGLRPYQRSGWKQSALGLVASGARLGSTVVRPNRPLLPAAAVHAAENYARRRAQHDCVLDCSQVQTDLGWTGSSAYADAVQRSVAWHLAQINAR